MSEHELRLLGNVEVRVAGVPAALEPLTAKVLAMLAAAGPGRGVARVDLVAGLWPDEPAGNLWAAVSKLRSHLKPLGVTVSSARGSGTYELCPLPGPTGADPAALSDVTAFTDLLDRGERELAAGRPVAACASLAAAAALWRGRPFSIGGEDWAPWACRAARDRLAGQERRLGRVWANAGLAAADPAALDWIGADSERAAALADDRDVWLLGFAARIAVGDMPAAVARLERRRADSGYDDPLVVRGAQLLALTELGVDLPCAGAAAGSGAGAGASSGAEFAAGASPAAGPVRSGFAAFAAAVPDGAAGLLAVDGAPTQARAAALAELAATASAAGLRVVSASGGEDDQAPWRALLGRLWAVALADPRFPVAAHRTTLTDLLASPRPWPPAPAPGLVAAATAVVREPARRRPLLVVIDEAHRLTGPAVRLLDELRAATKGAPVGFVVAGVRPGAALAEPPDRAVALDARSADRTRGSHAGSIYPADRLPGSGAEPADPADFVAAPGAGPADRMLAPGVGAADPAPAAADWVAAAALTAATPTAGGTAIDPVLVAGVLGVPAEQADAGLAAALRSGVVVPGDPVRFAGPEVLATVLAELATEPGRARRWHLAAHRLLAGGDPARLARHALGARPLLDDAVVAAACLAGAGTERAAGRAAAAVDLAVRGLALTADPELRFELQVVQGDGHHDRAEMRAAATAYRAAYDGAAGPDAARRRAVAAVRLARRWSDPGRTDLALLRMLERSRAELRDTGGDQQLHDLRLQLDAHYASKSTMALPGADPEPGVALARATLAELTDTTAPIVACEVLVEARWALFDHAPPAEMRAISARLEEAAAATGTADDARHFQGEAHITTVIDHLRLGDLAAAHRASEEHRDHVARTRQGLGPWLQLTLDSLFDLWDGDLAAAERRITGPARRMLEDHPLDAADSLQQTLMGQLFWLRREQGRMGDLLADGTGRLAQRRQYFPVWSAGMVLLAAEIGQPAAAVDQLTAVLAQTDDLRALPPHGWSVSTLALLAEAIDGILRHGPADLTDLAGRVDALLEPHADELALAGWPTVLIGPVARSRGLLALAVGDLDAAEAHFAAGASAVGAASAQLAWLRVHQARVLLARSGPSDRARELLGLAVDSAAPRGMNALVRLAQHELSRC